MKNNHIKKWSLFVSSALLLFAVSANAQQALVFEQWINDYEGCIGNVFQSEDPYAWNGWAEEWGWDGEDGGGVHYFVILFGDIIGSTSGQVPPNSVVISAVLSLYITDPGDTASVYELLTPFDDQSDLSLFNGGVEPRSGIDYNSTRISLTPEPSVSEAYLEIDVTESVQRIVNGADNLGWIFIPNGSGGVDFNSTWAEANAPKLRVIIEGEPTTQGRRTLSKKTANVGDVIDVGINLSLESGSEDVAIVETPPIGWNVSEISDGGIFENGVISWTLENFSGSKTVSYKGEATSQSSVAPVFEGYINEFFQVAGESSLQVYPPLYATGNVLAVGLWNDSNGSSDLVATAELSDNEGTVYVRDSGAPEGWPQGTIFRWKSVWDGLSGEEEAGWQQRDFDDSGWIEQTDVGFTIGMGSGTYEMGETPLSDFDETIYTRSIFDLPNVDSIFQMTLKLEGDDSAVAWLNGMYIGVAGSDSGDDGEKPWEFTYSTTTGGGDDVSGEASTDFVPGETFIIQIKPEPSSLNRIMPEPAFVAGEAIEGIQISVQVPDGETPDLTITETPPAGWTITNVNASQGQFTLENGGIVWTIAQASGNPILSYDAAPPSDAVAGDWSGSGTDGTFNIFIEGQSNMVPYQGPVKLYREGNVLAVGLWNGGFDSSDLVATAELSDSHGNYYVRDSSAPGGWPQDTIFRWKTVYSDDGTGAEEPGWQQRDFDDSAWTEPARVGFTIGHGSSTDENGETQLAESDETVYTRSIFDAIDYNTIQWLTLKIEADDTGIAWLNGEYITYDGGEDGTNEEVVPEFSFDTISNGGNEVTKEPAATYQNGSTVHLLVDLVESTPVKDWQLY
ncbi:MAG: hypothetical protein JXR73_03185 [Candidatus Omnitrophica bacterium]|nr:hypothetical protein [Candidatus Omnitrophota bacterium]